VGAQLFHEGGRTSEGHDEASSRCIVILRKCLKKTEHPRGYFLCTAKQSPENCKALTKQFSGPSYTTPTGYGLDDLGFDSQKQQETCLFSKTNRPAVRPHQPFIQWAQGVIPSPGYSGRNMRLTTYLHLLPTLRMSGAVSPLPIYAVMSRTWTILLSP
jgi:hypothetical protein